MDTLALAELHCLAMHTDDKTVTGRMLIELHRAVPDWHIVEREGLCYLQRVFAFGSFTQALTITNRAGAQAQVERHHPSIRTEMSRSPLRRWVRPTLWIESN